MSANVFFCWWCLCEANEIFGTTTYDDINLSRHTLCTLWSTTTAHSHPKFGRLVSTWRTRHSKCDHEFLLITQCFRCRMTTPLNMFLVLLCCREQLIAFIWNCLFSAAKNKRATRKISRTVSFYCFVSGHSFGHCGCWWATDKFFTTATNINLLDKFGLITEKSYAVVVIIANSRRRQPHSFYTKCEIHLAGTFAFFTVRYVW